MSEIEKYYNREIHVDFDEEIEELKADIEEYRDSTTWWSNRFNAVERDNRELRKEIERLNNIIENLTTMTVNGDRTQIKNTAQYKIDRAIEYHDNCVNNLLDLDKIDENERLVI